MMRKNDDKVISDYKSFEAFLKVEQEAKLIEMKFNPRLTKKDRHKKTRDLKVLETEFRKKRKKKIQENKTLEVVAKSVKNAPFPPRDTKERQQLKKRLFSPIEEIKRKYNYSKKTVSSSIE